MPASTLPTWLPAQVQNAVQQHLAGVDNEQAFFVYDLDALAQHLKMLQQQDVVKLWYAVKANPLSKVLQTLADSGFNFDVASRGELAQVLAQDVAPQRVLNTGPAKSLAQLREFLAREVSVFVAESINQLRWLQQAAREQEQRPQVLLRVQLQWPESEKNPLGGGSLTPFGLAPQQWGGVQLQDFPDLDICGLHIFQWGNLLCNDKMHSLWTQMLPPLQQLASSLGMDFKILDLGGGLGLDYLQQQQQLSWPRLLDDLADIKQQSGVDEIWLELGRYAVGACGYYVVPVLDRKENYQQQQLVLAAGINHLLRPALTEQAFPVALLRASQAEATTFHLHGPLCTSLDKLGVLPLPADVAVGEPLIFGYCGAYGFTESMPYFLCHDVAAEYVLEQHELTLVRAPLAAREYLR